MVVEDVVVGEGDVRHADDVPAHPDRGRENRAGEQHRPGTDLARSAGRRRTGRRRWRTAPPPARGAGRRARPGRARAPGRAPRRPLGARRAPRAHRAPAGHRAASSPSEAGSSSTHAEHLAAGAPGCLGDLAGEAAGRDEDEGCAHVPTLASRLTGGLRSSAGVLGLPRLQPVLAPPPATGCGSPPTSGSDDASDAGPVAGRHDRHREVADVRRPEVAHREARGSPVGESDQPLSTREAARSACRGTGRAAGGPCASPARARRP